MNFKNLNDEQLTNLLQESNKMAFAEIYDRNWYKLYCIAMNFLGVKEEAEEIIQDVFEQIWNKRSELIIHNLSAYLVVSVKHKCHNRFKSQINFKKYQEFLIFSEIQQNGEDIINYEDLMAAVEKAMENLPAKTCEIFKKSRFENQSVKEIAAELHLTEKAVEYHITKSLKVLKNDLKYYHSAN